ncbi:MAG: hypothetical protein GF384_00755 [Elusimicrobia bacterium]|nr:hypothetical protein [Elusimicrobiota bacterium]
MFKRYYNLLAWISIVLIIILPLYGQEYRLGPEDVLKISVYREDELNRIVQISSDGSISFPLLGKLDVSGLTVAELEKKLTQGLSEYIINPQVTVFIQEYTMITVTGEVKNPGSYPLRGELTVLEAIGLAGGFTDIAARNRVKILRVDENGKKKSIKVKVGKISNRGDRTKDIPLRRNDIVHVPQSLF